MNPRVQIFNHILKFSADHNIRLNRFWGGFIETARFKLGESIKDIKIPFAVDSESGDVIREAIEDLIDFVRRRHEIKVKSPTDRSIDDFVAKTKLANKTNLIRSARKGTLERKIIEAGILTDPLLDAGIFEAWLAPQMSGAKFLAIVQGILNKSLLEEIKAEHLEKTSYISLLGLISQINQAKSILKKLSIRGVKYEQLDTTFGNVVFLCLNYILWAVIEELRNKRLGSHIEFTFLLLTSTCHPLSFVSIKNSVARAKFNPYQISQDLIDLLDPLYRQTSERNTELGFVESAMTQRILDEPHYKKAVLEESLALSLRASLLDFLFENDNTSLPLTLKMSQISQESMSLASCVTDKASAGALAEEIREYQKAVARAEDKMALLLPIENLLRFIEKGVMPSKRNFATELVQATVSNYLGFKIDLYLDQFTNEAVNLMDNRQEKMPVAQLKSDYESGRLYRISADGKPTLQEFTEKAEGQLFIDLKDFTKRTHFSKEIIMADFLQSEFYTPILEAARKYHETYDTSGNPFKLVNLLGDAVIFSGSIEALVYLAKDIQKIFQEYRQKLKANSPSNLENELKDKINSSFQTKIAKAQQAHDYAQQRTTSLQGEITRRIGEKFDAFVEGLPQQIIQEMTQLEGQFIQIDQKLHLVKDLPTRYELATQKNTLIQRIATLRGLQEQFIRDFPKSSRPQQIELLGQFFCRDLDMEITSLSETLGILQKKIENLRVEYEREIKKIDGFGMDAGLFISFGSSAESVHLEDELWGKLEVSVAETINESARGTARNPSIKKMLDARLGEEVTRRGNKNLQYPYHIFVEKTYSFQFPPQQNSDFNQALKLGNLPAAETIVQNLLQSALADTRETIQGGVATSSERRILLDTTDIYNEGEALSEAALNAFIRETSTTRYNFRKTNAVKIFHKQIQEQFVFSSDLFQCVLSLNIDRPRSDPLIFRYAGDLTFRGFEERQPVKIYELCKFDSPFYQLLIKHHLDDWLKEFGIKAS